MSFPSRTHAIRGIAAIGLTQTGMLLRSVSYSPGKLCLAGFNHTSVPLLAAFDLIFLRKRGQGFLLFNQLLGLVKLLSNSSGD